MAPIVNEVSIDNVPINWNPLVHNEKIEYEVEDVEEIERGKGVKDKATGIPLVDPVLAQQIMSFLKGLADLRMPPPAQAPTDPPVARNAPKTVKWDVTMPSFILCWVLGCM